MTDLGRLPAARVAALAAIGQVAAEPAGRASDGDGTDARVERALEALAGLTACDAVSLSAWDAVAGRHRLLGAHGYSAAELAPGHAAAFLHDDGYRLARRSRWPLRRSEVIARDLERVVVLPRFREGVTACLFTSDLRYTGMLNYSRVDEEPIDDATIHALALVVPTLAQLTDPTASVRAAAALFEPSAAVVAVCGGGRVDRLADRPSSPLLAPGGALLRAAADALRGAGVARFLVADRAGEVWRAMAVRAGDARAGDAMLVGVAPASTELTRRELEVLTLLAQGRTNPEIAAALIVSRHTVSTHIEHILRKLGVATRGAAAARAVRDGLLLMPVEVG